MGLYSEIAEYYDLIFPFREEVYSFLKSHFPEGSNRILDLGCGNGHYCGRFAEDGLHATGIDLDSEMVRVATSQHPKSEFQVMNMLDIDRLVPPYDGAFCVGNVLSHLHKDKLQLFLGKLCQVLRPGGIWIFQVVSWDYILSKDAYRFPVRTLGSTGFTFHRYYQEVSRQGASFETQLIKENRVIFSNKEQLYPVQSSDYERFHQQAGFEIIGHYSTYQGAQFSSSEDSASIFVAKLSTTTAK